MGRFDGSTVARGLLFGLAALVIFGASTCGGDPSGDAPVAPAGGPPIIAKLESAVTDLQRRVRAWEEQAARAGEDTRSAAELERTRRKLEGLREELARARRDLEAVRTENRRLSDRHRALLAELAYWTPIPNLGRADVPRLEARVVTIQDVDGALRVTMDAGADDGVTEGLEFSLLERGRPVAKLRVERVEADWCGARVVQLDPAAALHVGDRLVTRLP